jgi:STE24 endopeptidase
MNEDRSTRYHRRKRRWQALSLAWMAALMAGLLVSGGSAGLRSAAAAVAARLIPAWSAPVTIALYVIALMLLIEIARLPLSFFGGLVLDRHYGLSGQTAGRWLADEVKSTVVALLLAVPGVLLVYAMIRVSSRWWWIPSGVGLALATVGLARLSPVLLLPIFYRVKPLDRVSLRERLLNLARRAGARVLGAYEWGLSDKTWKANAALAGLGSSRRILVSDTMLTDYSDDEIEVVLAHELAHHVHGDIWKGLTFDAALIMAGLYGSARMLDIAVGPLALDGPGDVAGLPVLVLSARTVSLATTPAALALSRAHERHADRFALELTRNPAAFITAMRRLAAQNLAEEQPSKIVKWLFYSHPPVGERIAAAKAFTSSPLPAPPPAGAAPSG